MPVAALNQFDVVIVGGGLVGMSLAASLDGHGLRVLQLEATVARPLLPGWDERHFALGRASIERLRRIGAWSDSIDAHPIREIHVSRAGEFGRVLLRAADQGLTEYGCTAPARLLVGALEHRLAAATDIERWRPARLQRFVCGADSVELQVEYQDQLQTLQARLLVAADGTDSPIRTACAIPTECVDYQQTALVCAAEFERASGGRAFERFTESGPVAVLPLSERRCGVVFSHDRNDAEAALALADADYARLLQQRFGHRLGRVQRLGPRQPWPLRLLTADRLIDRRVVLIGNAAQTIHPMGAQGFNLGLRDAGTLANLMVAERVDVGAAGLLERYAELRASDRAQSIALSHGLVRLTVPGDLPSTLLRGFGMMMVDRISPLRDALARASMGYRGAVS
jgi:2-octaprenyl-6-methoxyphenol hydroxylase